MKSELTKRSRIAGCILGTAVGDAAGLLREGLSRSRAAKMYGEAPLSLNLAFGKGFCSDDTEHTVMVGRALAESGGDVDQFRRLFARDLKRWLLFMPAGVGLGTLRAIVKLWLGFGPSRSGVASAGNGPAMRSALLGLCAESDEHMKQLVSASTQLTHRDERAEEGALAIAKVARAASSSHGEVSAVGIINQIRDQSRGQQFAEYLTVAIECLEKGSTPAEYADRLGLARGVTGFINHSVPAALYCWAYSPTCFRSVVENAVTLGGDSDSVAAIAGAVAGSHSGEAAIPEQWVDELGEWPRNIAWMQQLADLLSHSAAGSYEAKAPAMHWAATAPRNAAFAALVLALGFRRLLPPY